MRKPPLVERAEAAGLVCPPALGRLAHVLAAERGRARAGTTIPALAPWIASALEPGVPLFVAGGDPLPDDPDVHRSRASSRRRPSTSSPSTGAIRPDSSSQAESRSLRAEPCRNRGSRGSTWPSGSRSPFGTGFRVRLSLPMAMSMPLGDLGSVFQDFVVWVLPVAFFLVLVLIVVLLWRTVALMPRVKPAQISPNSASAVTWDDVAGVQDAREELQEVVDFLRDPRRFEQLGARVPKGLLLYGPPGTGKTLLAKAVANESRATFFAASASSFVEMFAGLGAARIRKLFSEARKHAPAIIFIDELDAVGTARTGGGIHREHDQTLNQLLVELDGFDKSEQVVVMGASNRLQDLDTALLRPGRFDRQILVGPPDVAAREEILRVHTRGKPLHSDVDLSLVARQTAGLTGADLANIANEAAIFAGRGGRKQVHHHDFDAAMERIVAGLQQRRVVSEKEKRILAYHEAGHALMSHLMGDVLPVQKATIVSRGQALGYTLNLPSEDRYLHTREELIDQMKIILGGRAAEFVVFGRVTNGAANDLEKVTQLARAMVFEFGMGEEVASRTMRADNYALSEETKRLRDTEQARLTDEAYEDAVRLLQKHRPALDRLAQGLLEKETLQRDELLALLTDVEAESFASETVGTVKLLPASTDQ